MQKLMAIIIYLSGKSVRLAMPKIPPTKTDISRRINITETNGINKIFAIIEIKEKYPKVAKLIGIAKTCAETTVPKEFAILFGKNLKSFEVGLDKIKIPKTTTKDS